MAILHSYVTNYQRLIIKKCQKKTASTISEGQVQAGMATYQVQWSTEFEPRKEKDVPVLSKYFTC